MLGGTLMANTACPKPTNLQLFFEYLRMSLMVELRHLVCLIPNVRL